jgi:hypothetical protein
MWSKKNVKFVSGPTESTDLIFQILKYNLSSGETLPLKPSISQILSCLPREINFYILPFFYFLRPEVRINIYIDT